MTKRAKSHFLPHPSSYWYLASLALSLLRCTPYIAMWNLIASHRIIISMKKSCFPLILVCRTTHRTVLMALFFRRFLQQKWLAANYEWGKISYASAAITSSNDNTRFIRNFSVLSFISSTFFCVDIFSSIFRSRGAGDGRAKSGFVTNEQKTVNNELLCVLLEFNRQNSIETDQFTTTIEFRRFSLCGFLFINNLPTTSNNISDIEHLQLT